MVQLNLGALVLAFIAAMGVPSAVMGLIVWALKRRWRTMSGRSSSWDARTI